MMPIAFRMLPADKFPLTIEFIGQNSLKTHHTIRVERPAGLVSVRIPSLNHVGEPVVSVVWSPQGEPAVGWPDGRPPAEAEATPIYEELLDRMRKAAAGHS